MTYNFKKIGARIKRKREQKNIKLNKLAEMLNVQYQTISKWEKNQSEPSLFDLTRLCEIFNCELGYLLCEYDCETRESTDICEATGLSEQAISNLIKIKTKYDESNNQYQENKIYSDVNAIFTHEFLNDLISNAEYLKKIANMYHYCKQSIKYIENAKNDKNNREAGIRKEEDDLEGKEYKLSRVFINFVEDEIRHPESIINL
ncbi:MAG: helix-turn-helix transcriptional regulator [Bacillota bacterium]|nr:helix-turn-helix transcriptional regulator [Bacillota bacterium]